MKELETTRRGFLKGGVAVAGAAALAPWLAACSSESAATTAATTTTGGVTTTAAGSAAAFDLSGLAGKTIGHVVVDRSTPVSNRSSARGVALGEQYGFTVEVFDSAADYNAANNTLAVWAGRGFDGVINTGIDPSVIGDGLSQLNTAGIPSGGIYAGYAPGAGLTYDVTTNEWINFSKIGTYVLDRMGDGGGGVAIVNWPNVPVLRIRSEQIKAMLGFYSIPILSDEVVAVPGQVVDTKQRVSALLTRYPAGGELKCVVAGWDEIGIAAAQAIDEAHRDDVFVVAADGLLEALALMRAGSSFAATTSADVESMADVCYGQMAAILGGARPVSTSLYVDAPLVTKDNLPPEGQYALGTGLMVFYKQG